MIMLYARSSRSHAVFTLLLTMKRHDVETNMDTEKVSRIRCDLLSARFIADMPLPVSHVSSFTHQFSRFGRIGKSEFYGSDGPTTKRRSEHQQVADHIREGHFSPSTRKSSRSW
jgi:hypothetical protein